eukprot:CAMPEP_0114515994 /NCGR_PEP_ID=MMETSP0109-20121206/17077_1 /TAXON_ID=29199 /ORGANISM="Chlorarachnion reptans, Strain CCCM449" /LENGTH=763 /DNA_ID=CAMNT_0001696325 /DNA_START=107 /DNA_END=2398 /DNA_ORIENTATION=-
MDWASLASSPNETSSSSSSRGIPILDGSTATFSEFMSKYSIYKALLLRQCHKITGAHRNWTGLDGIREIFRQDAGSVRRAWTYETNEVLLNQNMETKGNDVRSNTSDSSRQTPESVLNNESGGLQRWYASFILQKDSPSLQHALDSLPIREPKCLRGVFHTDCVWFFFGRNDLCNRGRANVMTGKAEHVDDVRNDGTWHLQTTGTKVWYLRPNPSADWPTGEPPDITFTTDLGTDTPKVEVKVSAGDVLVLNTRLWFHQTSIPVHPRGELSLSYARDFFLLPDTDQNPIVPAIEADSKRRVQEPNSDMFMANRMGSWATSSITQGQEVFVENSAFSLQANPGIYLACATCGKSLLGVNEHLKMLSSNGRLRSDLVNQSNSERNDNAVPGIYLGLNHRNNRANINDEKGNNVARNHVDLAYCSVSCQRAGSLHHLLMNGKFKQFLDQCEPIEAGVPLDQDAKNTLLFAAHIVITAVAVHELQAITTVLAISALSESGRQWWEMKAIEEENPQLNKKLQDLAREAWQALCLEMEPAGFGEAARAIGFNGFARLLAAVFEKSWSFEYIDNNEIDEGESEEITKLPSLLELHTGEFLKQILSRGNQSEEPSSISQIRSHLTELEEGLNLEIPEGANSNEALLERAQNLHMLAQNFPAFVGFGIFPRTARVRVGDDDGEDPPNCMAVLDQSQPVVKVMAVRDIAAGEELILGGSSETGNENDHGSMNTQVESKQLDRSQTSSDSKQSSRTRQRDSSGSDSKSSKRQRN